MKEEFEIKNDFLKCHEWEQIQRSKLWREAEIQIARELIADNLIKNYLILDP